MAALVQACAEGSNRRVIVSLSRAAEKAEHLHLGLLRARRQRPRRRPAEQRDELAASHSITSSAATINLSGTARPRALAVFRLSTVSNRVGCTTGRSAGVAPLRILPT